MRKYIRIMAVALSIALIMSLCIACSNKPAEEKSSSGDTSSTQVAPKADQASKGPETLTLPIVKEPLTLTYFISLDPKAGATMTSYNEIAAYKEAEKRTGIHIEFQHPPAGQETEQFNLMLASQELPDIIYWTWFNVAGGPAKVIEDGSIIKLNDLINQYAPNLKKVLDTNPDARRQVMLDDGTFYMFPMLWIDPKVRVTAGFQIRKDWLDRLGLQTPTTIDEWYTVLKAFNEQDANGNGDVSDEIPLLSQKDGSGIKRFSGAWGINVSEGFYQVNGEIKYAPLEPQYKDFISTMAQWYKEGLIDPEYGSVDGKNFDAKITGDKGGSYYASVSGNMGRYMNLMAQKDPKFQLTGALWPIGPAGKPYSTDSNYSRATPGHGAAITSANKHQKETVKWLDYPYSDEGHMLFTYGIEGESYVIENGKPKFTDLILKSPKGLSIDQAVSQYAIPHFPIPIVRDPEAFDQIQLAWPVQKEAVAEWGKADTSLSLPPIMPTAEESSRLASIMNEINTYNDEMFNKFIMGQETINNFDNYVNTLKSMGIEEAIAIQQTALDRFNARK